MLAAIHAGDIQTYSRLTAEDVSCYEQDIAPYRIDGLDFHCDLMTAMKAQKVYAGLTRFDMLTPRVQVVGDTAVVTYTRLMTFAQQPPAHFAAFNETRVFAKTEAGWKMVHFHRSKAPVTSE